ncbi:glycosyltransferase [Singulisphaera acidiphila]|uniref:Glycosyltransferase n=1 Tax=Singulisphaera acidiphila (strain ATCC BAA-1392 / DSM 18658 / VKM B-2454 / MOB10) TaxID=886293 RepID=L0DIA6_SINAD|nr:hypothetical protein [Singulisphaera acidiphila]AGA28595.1 hypothetical protein Sinac_4404 [Singulisphaera acidiphila DSM 18658]
MKATRATILVSGMIAGHPNQGGASWVVLQYALGLRKLGHDVLLVEPIEATALRPAGSSLAESDNAAFFRRVVRSLGLERSSALLLAGTRQTVGVSYDRLERETRRADLLVNVSGMLTDPGLIGSIPRRVYIDVDPAFNQLWQEKHGIDMRYEGHTLFMTVGRAVGRPGCDVPTCGREWVATWPPVVLPLWPTAGLIRHHGFTTVANWRGYGSIEHGGLLFGQKAHTFRTLFDLPARARAPFMPALAIHPGEVPDLEALAANGWQILDPARLANTPARFRKFVQQSEAEFSTAKSGYVLSRCGWFSDRTACYLASGRPAIVQETGFQGEIPVGEGLFTFKTVDEAVEAVNAVRGDYPRHARAARHIAEEYLDSDKVLDRLLNLAFAT